MRTSTFLSFFLLMLMRRPGGSPKKQGAEAYFGLLMSQVPPFLKKKGSFAMKKNTFPRLKIQKMLKVFH